MYRVTRTATLKSSAMMMPAMKAQREFVEYLNKSYPGHDLVAGMEMFGKSRVHWTWTAKTMADLEQTNGKLMMDEKYWKMVEANTDFFLEGSLNETIMMIPE